MGAHRTEALVDDIRQVNTDAHPLTVRELVDLVSARHPKLATSQIVQAVKAASQEGEIVLTPPRFASFGHFFTNIRWNSDFWPVFLVSVAAGLSLLAIGTFPRSLLRLALILPLFFYFPGRALLKVLSRGSELTLLERTILEFGTSLVLILVIGLTLNLVGLGFLAASTVVTMILVNLILALTSSYRTYSVLAETS